MAEVLAKGRLARFHPDSVALAALVDCTEHKAFSHSAWIRAIVRVNGQRARAKGTSGRPGRRALYLRTANLSFADDDRGFSRFSSAEGRITSSAIET